MDADETLKTLQDTGERFEGYSVFTVNFNEIPIKMITLKDAQEMVAVKKKLDHKMNLSEAKQLFEKHHPEETAIIKQNKGIEFESYRAASCVWRGFKSALKVTGQLGEE